MRSTHPVLEVVGAVKAYGDLVAVDGVSFEAWPGEIVAIVGPSGCGKTTTLRLIAGLESLDAGSIWIDGEDATHLEPSKRGVGYMFQDHALFPHLTVHENVAFGLRKVTKLEERSRVEEVLDLVGLGGNQDRYPRELSGGQQQRVALARSLAPSPRILLLDEPFSNTDPQLRRRVRHDLLEIIHHAGVAALWVTHDRDEGFLVANRVVLMKDGEVKQTGSPSEIWRKPRDAWVAGFTGQGDLLEGVVVDEQVATKLGTVRAEGMAAGARVKVLVNPEDVVIGATGAPARVLRRHFSGAENIYCLELEDGEILHVKQPVELDMPRGTAVQVSFRTDTLPFFPE